jgi:ABC-type glycerol-3-phosphate transport system permease component
LSTFVGYGFAKFRCKGRDGPLWGMLSTTLLPFSSVIVKALGLLDSLWALIVPFALTGQREE